MQKKVFEATDSQNSSDIMKKEWLITGLFIVSLAGLLWSRAILSISMGVWFIFALWHFRSWIQEWRTNPLILWGLAPLFLGLLGVWQSPLEKSGWDHLLTLAAYPVVVLSMISIRFVQPQLFRRLSYCWVMPPYWQYCIH